MTAEEFLAAQPQAYAAPLRALWHDGHGDWHSAHEHAQAGEDKSSAWVHAYLHRKEGDQGNAEYWYRRAGKPVYRGPLEEEWKAMVEEMLASS